ncbi:MAG: hypothetical protein P0Y55_11945 [Candidatus Cohnella colombiensis]|uniref:ATP-binding protein n=1 Tax=Candidatus Cohnella colombiensis TaxID=3121368 RepID=A0AA95EUQ4_9BACL|nr:MAG: hypothetical protein P0Y55_11945 [Cohnella sp.]
MKLIEVQHPTYTAFRIIPHHTVLNSSSRNFQRSLYELFSVRYKPHREGFKIIVNPSPNFWWITTLKSDSIEYYCAMPTDFSEAFRTKFRNHEQWRKSTLEIVEDFELPIDEQTDLYALKYKRHDMFSLEADFSEQTTPVRNVLGVTNELAEGEAVSIFIRTETVSRKKWKKLADYAWEQWDKGSVPYRAGFDPLRLLRHVANGITHLFFEAKSLVDDVLAGFEKSFFHNNGGARQKAERPALPNPDRAELTVSGDLSPMSKNKRNLPVFKTSIRYTVTSQDTVKREMLARSVAGAYSIVTDKGRYHDNRLEMVKINIRAKEALNDLHNWRIRELSPNMMSVDELGKLQQLPTSELQLEFADALESNRRVEIELPKVFLDESGILAGTATDRGETYNIHIPTNRPDKLYMARGINGSPRMGKDQYVINMVVEAKRKHGIGAVIPDFIDERNGHRGMADAIRDHLPPDDVIDINLADTAYAPYLGLQSIFQNVKDSRVASDVIAEYLTDFLLSDGDDDKFQTMDFTREAAKVTNGDFTDMKEMFLSPTFRKKKIAELDNVFDMDTWRDFDKMSEGKQGQIFGPVLRRLNQIIGSEFLKPMFCQSFNPKMDLYRWLQDGKVVIIRCRMPDGIPMPERIKETLGYWIVMLTFLIKLAQDGKGAGTFLVLNEPHQFMSKGLVHFAKRMLREGPKYRLAPVIVFHDFSAFNEYPGFVDTLLSASINWHLFKNTHVDTYKKLMPYLGKTFADPQQAFDATKQYQYIGCWLHEGEYEAPFVCDALPMVGKRYESMDNSFLTKRHARQYGRPIAEVLADIKKRRGAK